MAFLGFAWWSIATTTVSITAAFSLRHGGRRELSAQLPLRVIGTPSSGPPLTHLAAKYSDLWDLRYTELTNCKNERGDCNVSQRQGSLGEWVVTQRKNYKKGKLSDERIARLKSIGFVWDPQEQQWLDRFDELTKYKAENGDCNVPRRQGPLGEWVGWQRKFYRKGNLSQERLDLLESIGFSWEPIDEAWMARFDELVDFKNENADCNVPESQGSLGVWVRTQRTSYKEGNLSQERLDLLESVGFIREPADEAWMARFDELVDYKNENGDCSVPYNQGPLGKWVSKQRFFYKKGKLSDERIDFLESVGFEWVLREQTHTKSSWKFDEQWKTRFTELVKYLIEHGNCNVRRKFGPLYWWVGKQRQDYKDGRMSQFRIAYLDSIGFAWTMKRVGNEWLPDQYSEPDPKAIARIIEDERPGHDDLPSSAVEDPKTHVDVGRGVAEALQEYLDKDSLRHNS